MKAFGVMLYFITSTLTLFASFPKHIYLLKCQKEHYEKNCHLESHDERAKYAFNEVRHVTAAFIVVVLCRRICAKHYCQRKSFER